MPDNLDLDACLAAIHKQFSVEFEPLEVDGNIIQTLAITNMPSHLNKLIQTKAIQNPLKDLPLWAKIWPASFILGRFLRRFDTRDKSLLELGAGMGVCSLIAARYGFSKILITDLIREALYFARANILHNNLDDIIDVKQVDVKNSFLNQKFDFIVASELLYLDDLHKALIKFLENHLAPQGKALFCTDFSRIKPKFQKLASKNFIIQEGKIGVKSMEDGQEKRNLYSILVLEKNEKN